MIEGADEHSHRVARRVVEAFTAPFDVSGQLLVVRPSVGLAVAAPDDAQLSATVLLQQADAAMYAAKRLRSGGLQTFSSGMASAARRDPTDGPTAGRRATAPRPCGCSASCGRLSNSWIWSRSTNRSSTCAARRLSV